MMRNISGELSLKEVAPYVTSKLNMFVHNHIIRGIVCKPKSSIDLRAIMDGRKILLVNLAKGHIGKMNAGFLGLVLSSLILRETLRRSPASPDFFLYVDEFQNLATPSFVEMLAEARKFRLAAILANQYLHQIPEEVRRSILGNVGTLISLRLGPEDAEILESHFSPSFDRTDLLNLPFGRACASLLVNGAKLQPFSLETTFKPRPGKGGCHDEKTSAGAAGIREARREVGESLIKEPRVCERPGNGKKNPGGA